MCEEVCTLAPELHNLFPDVSLRRCVRVLRNHPEISDVITLYKLAPELLEEACKVGSLSAAGVQCKYWLDGVLYKVDDSGLCQGCKEFIISKALDLVSYSIHNVSHVTYNTYRKGDKVGCTCSSYRTYGDTEVALGLLPDGETLDTLSASKSLKPVLRDIAITFMCDALFYNEDRHMGNIILLFNEDDARLAPIFDMGNSLCFATTPDYSHYEPEPYLHEQVEWAFDILSRHKLKFALSEFIAHTSDYPPQVAQGLCNKVRACAQSDFIGRYFDVV